MAYVAQAERTSIQRPSRCFNRILYFERCGIAGSPLRSAMCDQGVTQSMCDNTWQCTRPNTKGIALHLCSIPVVEISNHLCIDSSGCPLSVHHAMSMVTESKLRVASRKLPQTALLLLNALSDMAESIPAIPQMLFMSTQNRVFGEDPLQSVRY